MNLPFAFTIADVPAAAMPALKALVVAKGGTVTAVAPDAPYDDVISISGVTASVRHNEAKQ